MFLKKTCNFNESNNKKPQTMVKLNLTTSEIDEDSLKEILESWSLAKEYKLTEKEGGFYGKGLFLEKSLFNCFVITGRKKENNTVIRISGIFGGILLKYKTVVLVVMILSLFFVLPLLWLYGLITLILAFFKWTPIEKEIASHIKNHPSLHQIKDN